MIPADTPAGTELRIDDGDRCRLVQWRPRRALVRTSQHVGGSRYEWTVDTDRLRLLTEADHVADRLLALRRKGRELCGQVANRIADGERTSAAEVEQLNAALSALLGGA